MPLSGHDFADEDDNDLFRAIKAKDWDAVENLLKPSTVSADDKTNLLQELDCYDNTALHAALGYQAPEDIVLGLIRGYPQATKIHGANEWLPLHVAAMYGSSTAVMTQLIRHHPRGLDDRGQQDNKGRTPRHFKDRFKCNKELLERSTEDWIVWIDQQQQRQPGK